MRRVDRDALTTKNRLYLQSVRKDTPNQDLRSQILGAIFDSLADAILVVDETKRIVLANETAARISQWDLEDVSREQLRERYRMYEDEYTETQLAVEDEPMEVAMRDKVTCQRQMFVRDISQSSQNMWMRGHAAPVLDEDGAVVGGVTVFQDITEMVRAQKQRDCLISLIAHDLKNHLAAESITLKLMEGLLPSELSESLLSIARTVQRGNERYLMMTESLLELSRSQFFAGSEHAKAVDLREVLQNGITANEPAALQKKVKIDLAIAKDLPPALGLPATIHQVFTNVIFNAIEVSNEGATVEVKAARTADGNPSVVIVDYGPGMSAEELDALFDPKRVATHQKQSSHSTGFGLYLTAMLVESQHGRVACKSKEGEGTIVCIEFPGAQPD